MFRTKSYRRLQRKKRENKVKNLIKNIWQDEYNENCHYNKILINTPKRCNCDCCRNPRRNKWNDKKQKLTIQELKNKDKFKSML